MNHVVETQWMGKMQFNALVDGHTLVMDAKEKSGGEDNGPIPKPLVLTALSGCSGIDVVALLRKGGRELHDFSMTVSGELSRQAPISYSSIHIQYLFQGKMEDQEAALQAVEDSQEKYCGVSAMLKKALPVTWEVIFNGELIFSNQKQEVSA
jgi:putative redox protein